MIFQQVEEIAQGLKTCTQRVQKEGEREIHNNEGVIYNVFSSYSDDYSSPDRLKWRVGGIYNVVPGRGKLTVLMSPCPLYDPPMLLYPECREHDRLYRQEGFLPLQIRVTQIESVRLQSMNTTVAKAEGVKSKQAYKKLWQSINGKTKGARWEDNPMVWRLWFEVVK